MLCSTNDAERIRVANCRKALGLFDAETPDSAVLQLKNRFCIHSVLAVGLLSKYFMPMPVTFATGRSEHFDPRRGGSPCDPFTTDASARSPLWSCWSLLELLPY